MVNESHLCLSLNCLISHLLFDTYLNILKLAIILASFCEHPIILKLCLGVTYNSQKYAYENSNL